MLNVEASPVLLLLFRWTSQRKKMKQLFFELWAYLFFINLSLLKIHRNTKPPEINIYSKIWVWQNGLNLFLNATLFTVFFLLSSSQKIPKDKSFCKIIESQIMGLHRSRTPLPAILGTWFLCILSTWQSHFFIIKIELLHSESLGCGI